MDKVNKNKKVKNVHESWDEIKTAGLISEESFRVWQYSPCQNRRDKSASLQVADDFGLRGKGKDKTKGASFRNSEDHDHNENAEFIKMKPLSLNNGRTEQGSYVNTSGTDKAFGTEKPLLYQLSACHIKKVCLVIFWVLTTGALICKEEKFIQTKTILIPAYEEKYFNLQKNPYGDCFELTLRGPFADKPVDENSTNFVTVEIIPIEHENENGTFIESLIDPWILGTTDPDSYENVELKTKSNKIHLPTKIASNATLQLKISQKNSPNDLTLQFTYKSAITDGMSGALIAISVLVVFYGVLTSEVLDRTFAALITAIGSVAILALLGQRPTVHEIAKWMDMDTLMLLFSMMIFVSILSDTGIFDYLAVSAFEISGGNMWRMIYCLCFFTCCVSAFLDNVTTVLIMTPVAIRLSEVMEIDAVPIIMAVIMHANIGGALSPIGDTISMVISTNRYIVNHNITFLKFILHTAPGVIMTLIQSCLQLRFMFPAIESMRLGEPKVAKNIKQQIVVWQRAIHSLVSNSMDAEIVRLTLLKKIRSLEHKLQKIETGILPTDEYHDNLQELKAKYPIKDRVLLMKTIVVFALVIIMYFIQSIQELRTIPSGWVALFGAILILIVTGRDDFDELMPRIKWLTLLFFASMCVTMECLDRLGLIASIGALTERMILAVSQDYRLAMAIFLILWMSALVSSVVESFTVTAMMIRVVVSLAEKKSLNLPLQPLVWALTFGVSFGGSGTLYGSSANIVAVDVAEQYGYKLTFLHYFRIVFPIMICQIAVITAYLLFAHIVLEL